MFKNSVNALSLRSTIFVNERAKKTAFDDRVAICDGETMAQMCKMRVA